MFNDKAHTLTIKNVSDSKQIFFVCPLRYKYVILSMLAT